MNKFDEAIEFLKQVEPGSYFDECAELMEELLALAHQPKTLPKVLVSGRVKSKCYLLTTKALTNTMGC